MGNVVANADKSFMNSQTPTGRSPLIPNLLLDAEDDRGVDLEFLAEVVKLFEEQDDLKPTIITTVEQISQELSTKTMNDDYKPYVTVRVLSVNSQILC
jgi:ubiquitin conjugation factor E4 B